MHRSLRCRIQDKMGQPQIVIENSTRAREKKLTTIFVKNKKYNLEWSILEQINSVIPQFLQYR